MTAIGGLGPAILGVLWTLVGLSAVLMALRTYAASHKSGKLRWDYLWMMLAFISAAVAAIFIHIDVTKGLGNHFKNLQISQIWDVFFWFYLTIYAGTISIMFSKFAVISLLLDVYKGARATKRRWILWGIGFLFAVTTLLEIFLTAFQCNPTRKVWNLVAEGECRYSKPAKAISYVHAGTGAVTDIILALWPVSIVWNLNASRYIKISICALMGLGVIPGVAALVRIDLLVRLHRTRDPTYESGLFLMSAAIEAGSLIILGSVPPLRPLFSRVFKGSSAATSYGATHPTATHGTTRDMRSRKTANRTSDEDLGLVEKEMTSRAEPIVVEQTFRVHTTRPSSRADELDESTV